MSNDPKRPVATAGNGDNAEADSDSVSFLRRWSARKLEHAGDEPAEPQALESAASGKAAPHDDVEPELGDADMPPLESLNEHSDYSGFFSSGVTEELRRLALRKLFHSPAFNVTDGLDDYAEDYTTFAKLGDMVTHDMRRMLELEARRAQHQADSEAAEAGAAATDADDAGASGDRLAGEPIENVGQAAPMPASGSDEDRDA